MYINCPQRIYNHPVQVDFLLISVFLGRIVLYGTLSDGILLKL